MEMASVLLTITYFFLFMGSKTGEGSDPDVRYYTVNNHKTYYMLQENDLRLGSLHEIL